MTKIYTIGSNSKSPKQFFTLLKQNQIDLVIDIRLNNKSQLSGFAKGGEDFLGFLLYNICGIAYIHDTLFSPSQEILDKYHNDKNWDDYQKKFNKLISLREMKKHFMAKYSNYKRVCFLCAEDEPAKCHRRLVAEAISKEVTNL